MKAIIVAIAGPASTFVPPMPFPEPHKIDARKCISYLTIENKGPIPLEYRNLIGNRIFGCDDCLAICPWNKFAKMASESKLQPREDLMQPTLSFLLTLDDAAFRAYFSASPVKRIGRDRFMRNVLIAAGNSEDYTNAVLIDQLVAHIKDVNALVRGAAVWAFRKLAHEDMITRHRQHFLAIENDEKVRWEWNCDLVRYNNDNKI